MLVCIEDVTSNLIRLQLKEWSIVVILLGVFKILSIIFFVKINNNKINK